MPDPIQVEQDFQKLIEYFDSALSIRHRYKLFFDFIDTLEGEFKKYESYIIQLLDDLPLFTDHLSWSGIDPKEIEENLSVLERIHTQIDLSGKNDQYNERKKNLQEVCLLLFSCLNHLEKAVYYLRKGTGLSWPEANSIENYEGLENRGLDWLFEILSVELKRESKRSAEQQEFLERLHEQVKDLSDSRERSILVPVAEKYSLDQTGSSQYGRLRKMSVELYGEADSNSRDELIWMTNIYGAEIPSLEQTKASILASRKLFASGSNRTNSGYYRGGVRFENTVAFHNGNSANLGIAALWYSILLGTGKQRERYTVYSNVAITGDINKDGSVQPVDETSIRLKAEAVFFSWATMLVIPSSQRAQFEAEVEKLSKKYPDRGLEVIGVNRLEEIFYDRRIAAHNVQGRIHYLLNRLKNEHSKFVLIPVIIALLLVVLRLVYGPIDRNPQNFSYEGSSLIIENKNGAEIERIEVGEQTAFRYKNPATIEGFPLTILFDINNDGINEVIYGKRNRLNQSNREISDVTAYSVSGDSIIWNRELMLNYNFPRQSGVTQKEMLIREMGLVETDDGFKVVVNANSFYYFQTILYLVDAESGEVESEYLHIGHIRDMIIEDIDGDEREDVIFTGINNAYWLASMGVLDVENFHGFSPLTRDYKPAGIHSANELYYILLPKTVIAEYTSPILKYNEGRSIYYDVANQTTRVLVEEGRTTFRNQVGEVLVSVSFDENMEPSGVGTSDVYDIVARDLYEEGEIREVPDFDYFETYKDSILYWTGEEFLLTREYFKNN
ncbi:MAG: hypothetical protein U5K72_15210 [Balneolaceae bacterium]|nr:hypothetical protein [Balneolaceae bacterium]